MERIIFEMEYSAYSIEFEKSNNLDLYSGNVYPVNEYTNLMGENVLLYEPKTYGGRNYKILNEDCRNLFSFSFCWRGVWEGRIYFKDSEYWTEELKTMNELWTKIEQLLKEKIKQDNPDYTYED